MSKLTGRVAVVRGASKGIGSGIATALAAAGRARGHELLLDRPKALLAAKTYAKAPLKAALSVGFCIFEGRSSVSAKTLRRCME